MAPCGGIDTAYDTRRPALSLHQLRRGQRRHDRQPGGGRLQRPGPADRRVPGAVRRGEHLDHARGPVRLHRDVRRQNNSRLTQMTYPNGRVLDYNYNSGLDSSISRLSVIADDNGGSPGTTLEGYTLPGPGHDRAVCAPRGRDQPDLHPAVRRHALQQRRRRPVHGPGPLRPGDRPELVEPDDAVPRPTASSTATTATATSCTRTTW